MKQRMPQIDANAGGSMLSISSTKPLQQSLGTLMRWALDLQGETYPENQCCDRLRPSWIRQGLLDAVSRLGGQLIGWEWSAIRRRADGYLLIANQICAFRWTPASERLQIRELLSLSSMAGPLTVVP